jgi:3-ketosteroid 9alpha-monooxygenase subunit B
MTGLNFHTLQIADVIAETPDATSFVFSLTEPQRARFDYRPGQFLTLRIPSDRGQVARCYSLSSSPHTDTDLKITVKRTADGYGSNWLCDNITDGASIDVLEPSGTFTPASLDADFVLFAGGSGITPVMSIVKSVLAAGQGTVTLVYANRDEKSVVFAEELAAMVAADPGRITVLHWLESVQGLPTPDALDALLAGRKVDTVFVCGPKPFMKVVRDTQCWRSLPRDATRIERFASLGGDPFEDAVEFSSSEPGDAAPQSDAATTHDDAVAQNDSTEQSGSTTELTVTLDGETQSLTWPRESTLLAFLQSKGISAPFSCTEGICSACECRVVDGKVEMANNQVLEEDDLAEGYALACQARPLTDAVTVTYDNE